MTGGIEEDMVTSLRRLSHVSFYVTSDAVTQIAIRNPLRGSESVMSRAGIMKDSLSTSAGLLIRLANFKTRKCRKQDTVGHLALFLHFRSRVKLNMFQLIV